MDERPRFADESRPADFKLQSDGRGGLIRVQLTGPPHEGRSLYIDELDLPPEIWTTAGTDHFEWWSDRTQRAREEAGANQPRGVRHVLHIPEDTREPVYLSEHAARA